MKRFFVVGCSGLLALLVAAIVAGIYFGPRLVQKGKDWWHGYAAEMERVGSIESAWTPPASDLTDPQLWFPKQMQNWQLQSPPVPIEGLSRLGLDRRTLGGAYHTQGQLIEVNVLPANDLEKQAIFSRVKTTLTSESGSRSSSEYHQRLRITLNGNDQNIIWWVKGWLFIFHTVHEEGNLHSFADDFLTEIDAHASRGIEVEAPSTQVTPAPEHP